MSTAPSASDQNVYGITYATIDERGIRFESELAILDLVAKQCFEFLR